MRILALGLMMLLMAAIGQAQQPVPFPQSQQPQLVQPAPPAPPLAPAERRRLEEIQARRARGEPISPEDRAFAQQMTARANQAAKTLVAPVVLPARSPLERAIGVPQGKWWTRPEMAQKLGLTPDQTKKMEETFQQFRLKLIDLNAAVQKEEVIMEPLVESQQPDETKIVAQIEKLAQARAELEKANARMLLGIRRLLTQEQWNKLKADPGPAFYLAPTATRVITRESPSPAR